MLSAHCGLAGPLHASLVVLRGCHPASVCRLDGVAAARRRVLGQAGFQACARPQVLSVSPSLGVGRRVTRRCRRRRALGSCVACGRWCFFASFDRRVGPPRLNANRYTAAGATLDARLSGSLLFSNNPRARRKNRFTALPLALAHRRSGPLRLASRPLRKLGCASGRVVDFDGGASLGAGAVLTGLVELGRCRFGVVAV